MRIRVLFFFLGFVVLFNAQAAAPEVEFKRVLASRSFERPIAMVQPPGEASWYVIEKAGLIWRQSGDEFTLFADLTKRIESRPNEAGLLGIAFHPDYQDNGLLFLSYTVQSNPLRSVLARFQSENGRLVEGSAHTLLTVEQPYGNHNSGQLAFGPDGYLYFSLGDGGSAGDPADNGQNPNTLLGSLLRLDVDKGESYAIPKDNPFHSGGGAPEIYAYGLRNPWGWGFDRDNGQLWLADVGQDAWEEVNIIRAGGNYGWNLREGSHCYARPDCSSKGVVDPVLEYSHEEGCSITGGYVYRGQTIPELQGHYLFSDFCTGQVWAYDVKSETRHALARLSINPSSFAQDHDGELYITDISSGHIYKLLPR
ncbi:MAG: PQQ-dependent sugar dehydrogenase [Gammaproteobacteria bacterium]|nr:PQQ-dependent sugar dehydrogenase [Gammaproteobacteria bacterium]